MDQYVNALTKINGSLLPRERRDEARKAVRRFRESDDHTGLKKYMVDFLAESERDLQKRYGTLIAEFTSAALVDTSYSIAIARPAGQLAARRRAREMALEHPESESDGLKPSTPPRVRTCPENHSHARTQSCYTRHSCRCVECVSMMSDHRKRRRLAQAPTRTNAPMKRAEWTPEPLSEDDPRHGTRNAYLNFKCRCDSCSSANRDYLAQRRKTGNTGTRKKTSEHGSTGRYVRGCRCVLCAQAMSKYNADRKNKNQS